ncbi:MAG: methylenetetrahydrofolate reductase [Polyangiaceae bacterium]|nr:methylenetetrahydrofolate reductase [Polyangiaceae bacterium]
MTEQNSGLQRRISARQELILAESTPPRSGDPAGLRAKAKLYAGRVHALGITDNQDGVRMAAWAAAAIVAGEGVEPLLHIVTRDRNRTALVADYLGARALGIHNVLCTSGTHHVLGPNHSARAVFDLDCVQLLRTYAELGADASVVGVSRVEGAGGACLGATASPFADPAELQMMRLAKKIDAGARFLVTQPVFDVDRFASWWTQVCARGLERKARFVAGILVLTSSSAAGRHAEQRPDPALPASVLERLASAGDAKAQRSAGIEVAVETVQRLRGLSGLGGFCFRAEEDDAAILEVVSRSGLGS